MRIGQYVQFSRRLPVIIYKSIAAKDAYVQTQSRPYSRAPGLSQLSFPSQASNPVLV